MGRRKDPIQQRIEELTEELKELRDEAMNEAGYEEHGHKEVASFHGVIGGKNNDYVDAVRQVFLSPEQFLAEWKEGALAQAAERDAKEIKTYGRRRQDAAVHRVIRLLQSPVVANYIDLFLERNFYNQHHARVRAKPEDSLWELWFGPKNQEYGLFITPRFEDGKWENDVSHIRRSEFDYWTIGHVLKSGFVIPKRKKVHAVGSLDDLFDLYHNVFVRSAGSVYSSAFAEAYEEFVREQDEPDSLPFLIPEFRYEGDRILHGHRLDFTILSAPRNLKLGIELSPWSSHLQVRGKKKLRAKGGEKAVDAEQIRLWEKDAEKRNEYFTKFGMTTLTFTSSKLVSIEKAFSELKPYLLPRKKKTTSPPAVESALSSYKFDRGNQK